MKVSSGATATLSSITIDGNSEEATSVSKSLISSSGTLNIKDGTVLQNNVITSTGYFQSLGGAVYASGGTVNMTGGVIKNNSANMGGGIFLIGAEMNLSGGEIRDNKAVDTYTSSKRHPAAGGGICLYDGNAVLNVSGSAEIINNSSADMGGGISVGTFNGSNEPQTLNMTGGTVSGNSAGSAGGGIYVQAGLNADCVGTANISGGTISGNSMTGEGKGNKAFGGGGIYVNGTVIGSKTVHGILNLTNVLIKNNQAASQGGGYAACPISVTNVNVNDGAAVYSNTASSANEIYIEASYAYGSHSGDPEYYISSTMLGGTAYTWKYDDKTDQNGTEVPYDKLEGTLSAAAGESLSLRTDITSDANAEALAAVLITGNTSATRGGGIGSNGAVNIGKNANLIDITVNKVWANDSSSDRPDSIRVELYRSTEGSDEDPEYIGYQTMSPDSSGEWPSVTFRNLLVTDSSGAAYTYSVKEGNTEGYTAGISGNQEDGFTITNTKKPDTTQIEVSKTWVGKTGDQAVVDLYANDTVVRTVTLTEENDWRYVFDNLDVRDSSGEEITYTVKERAIQGWDSAVSGSADSGFVITNTYNETDKISIPVRKVWEGGTGEKAVVHLYADGTEVDSCELNEGNQWQYTFTDLDRTKDGNEIQYSIREDPVSGYTTTVTGNQETGFTVTNTMESTTAVSTTAPSSTVDSTASVSTFDAAETTYVNAETTVTDEATNTADATEAEDSTTDTEDTGSVNSVSTGDPTNTVTYTLVLLACILAAVGIGKRIRKRS